MEYLEIKNKWNESHRLWKQKLQNEAAHKLLEWNLWRKNRNQSIVIQKGWDKDKYLECLLTFEKSKKE